MQPLLEVFIFASNSVMQRTNAHINVKPQDWGGGGGGATYGKLTRRAFPWVGILTFGFCPGVANLT